MEIRRRPPNPSVKVANLEYAIPHKEAEPRNILEKIIWAKDREIEICKEKISLEELKSQIKDLPPTKNFSQALKNASKLPAVIAEIKKASPSKGVIREEFDPVSIANSYQEGGASCLSVLTEKQFFQGGFDVLVEVRKVVDIPILCKDFIFTPYQLYQARVAGADAVLFIASILSDQDFYYLSKVAFSLGLNVLVEVHNEEELLRVLDFEIFNLIGINNRDLKTFQTDLKITDVLGKKYYSLLKEKDILLISESGLFKRNDLDRVCSAGAKAVLIGECLMKQKDIKLGLRKIIGN